MALALLRGGLRAGRCISVRGVFQTTSGAFDIAGSQSLIADGRHSQQGDEGVTPRLGDADFAFRCVLRKQATKYNLLLSENRLRCMQLVLSTDSASNRNRLSFCVYQEIMNSFKVVVYHPRIVHCDGFGAPTWSSFAFPFLYECCQRLRMAHQ